VPLEKLPPVEVLLKSHANQSANAQGEGITMVGHRLVQRCRAVNEKGIEKLACWPLRASLSSVASAVTPEAIATLTAFGRV
jgi:hypothetical protein